WELGCYLYLKRDARYLYVALQPAQGAFSVDLYFDRGGVTRILDFHASAKLGEREGEFGQWPDWVWWNNHRASAVATILIYLPAVTPPSTGSSAPVIHAASSLARKRIAVTTSCG